MRNLVLAKRLNRDGLNIDLSSNRVEGKSGASSRGNSSSTSVF